MCSSDLRLICYTQTSQGQSAPQIQAHYRYDPFGRRTAKTRRKENHLLPLQRTGFDGRSRRRRKTHQGIRLQPRSGPAGLMEHRPHLVSPSAKQQPDERTNELPLPAHRSSGHAHAGHHQRRQHKLESGK